jgi:hypothetical protein
MTDNPILQDSQRPLSLRYPSSLSSKQRQAVYQGQVRAFLEASEIVEMEEDVLDDILDGFDDFDHDASDCVAGEQSFIPVRKLDRDAAGNIELPLPHGFYVYFGPQGMLLAAPLTYTYTVYRANARVPTPPPRAAARPHGPSLDDTTNQGDAWSSQTTRKAPFLRVWATLTTTVQDYRHS